MPTTQQLRTRLLNKLTELFQLDQPDLDFGFYKVMHAKAEQVESFLSDDLLQIVEDAFAGSQAEKTESEVETAKRKLIEAMGDDALAADGSVNPAFANTPAGKAYTEAVQKAGSQVASLSDEGQVYDHLFRFFERYYDNGDFVSRRYYARESDGRAAPFAIPYNGEEVKLHWANADQYYIKTAEYFNNYTFDLAQAAEFQGLSDIERAGSGIPEHPLRVHFKIVDATEGEHGNVKAKDDEKRFFLIHAEEPISFDENGELVIHFEYRPDPERGSKQEGSWRDQRNGEAVQAIYQALETVKEDNATAATCLRLFQAPAPTEKDKKRPLLAKYLNQYTARNTMDYFIHKDLGGFLRRELDFYIKNEVMRLDDLDAADAPSVESYLSKLKVLRKIAHKLIDFLAQLEDFQKKLWLKKKFVVETNYCITLDRIPEEFYAEIAANDAQREEWVKLFAIDEIEATEGDLVNPGCVGYSEPLTVEFLKYNDKLVLDTRFFDTKFKGRLLEVIEDFDAQCNGLLVHSENFQALNSLSYSINRQIDSIYIDPPYNAAATEIIYKNEYKHSSWCSFAENRILSSEAAMRSGGIICVTIDDYEIYNLKHLLDQCLGSHNFLAAVPIRNNPSGRSTVSGFAISHEYALFYTNSLSNVTVGRLPHNEEQRQRYGETDSKGRAFEWENFRKSSAGSFRLDRPKQFYPAFIDPENGRVRFPAASWSDNNKSWILEEEKRESEVEVLPIDSMNRERVWNFGLERARSEADEMQVKQKDGKWELYKKKYLKANGMLPRTWWDKPEYSARDNGTRELNKLFAGDKGFDFPKAVSAVADCLRVSGLSDNGICLDYFGGSGTTAQAVIELNREDEGNRKYLMVEMGNHFETTLRPRIKKVVYSTDWKDGKPTSRDTGISHCFKYIRLESYEDTLNNLVFAKEEKREESLKKSPQLKEDYMLRYLLDVETRGSQSLLNIDAFADPTAYQLKVKKPGSDQIELRPVDLIETFNFLIGLRVTHLAAPQTFSASFKRERDTELPEDQDTKLIVDGAIKQDEAGPWWFRKVEGWIPKNPSILDKDTIEKNPENMERVLVVWRKLTADLEQDNLMLDTWFRKHGISTQDYEFQTIYVNGSNNLPNLKTDAENWKVRLIEEEFMKRMWDTSDA